MYTLILFGKAFLLVLYTQDYPQDYFFASGMSWTLKKNLTLNLFTRHTVIVIYHDSFCLMRKKKKSTVWFNEQHR